MRTNSIDFVFICGNCRGGVFMRAPGDVRSCPCEQLTVNDGFVVNEASTDYSFEEAIPYKKTKAELVEDFETGADRFGVFGDADRMLAHLKANKIVAKPVRRGYFDDAEGQLALEA
jgi:hypothetical protein